MQVNGWELFAHPLLLDQLERLMAAVEKERAKKPKASQHSRVMRIPSAAAAALFRSVTNPAIAGGRLSYILPEAADVRLEAFDVSGRKVATVTQGTQAGGVHELLWGGREMAPGVYFLRLRAQPSDGPAVTDQRKVVLIK